MATNTKDEDHLRLLSIFYYIAAAITGLFSLFPIVHVFLGNSMLGEGSRGEHDPTQAIGLLFIGIGVFGIFAWVTTTLLMAIAGRFLARRKRHTLCFVIAVLSCLSIPIGTILGLLTIQVLSRESVKASFR